MLSVVRARSLPRRFPGRAALAAAAVAAGAVAAVAGALTREAMVTGDTVIGDLLAPGDVDEFTFEALLGATAIIDVRNAPPAGWRPSIAIVTSGYDHAFGLFGTGPTTARTDALPSSATYRMLVSGADDTTGGYRVRLTIDPGRSFTAFGTGDAQPLPVKFGALAGSRMTVALRWKGPAPVTVASVTGPAGPLVAPAPAAVRGKSSVLKGLRAEATGDHLVTIAVPAGTKSWDAVVKVAPPRPARGTTRDLRSGGVPGARSVSLVNVSDAVAIVVAGESGGPNELIVRGAGLHVGGFALDARSGACGVLGFEPAAAPLAYHYRCIAGWFAEIGDVVRTGNVVTSFRAPVVRTPRGSGSVAVEGIVYDQANRAVAWTETRTFDATGAVHVLAVSDVARRGDGAIVGYSVTHSRRTASGDELVGTYDYAPVRTR